MHIDLIRSKFGLIRTVSNSSSQVIELHKVQQTLAKLLVVLLGVVGRTAIREAVWVFEACILVGLDMDCKAEVSANLLVDLNCLEALEILEGQVLANGASSVPEKMVRVGLDAMLCDDIIDEIVKRSLFF